MGTSFSFIGLGTIFYGMYETRSEIIFGGIGMIIFGSSYRREYREQIMEYNELIRNNNLCIKLNDIAGKLDRIVNEKD